MKAVKGGGGTISRYFKATQTINVGGGLIATKNLTNNNKRGFTEIT
jgi:hypothetical protein